ncbi:MAG TPA: NifU N-terminal domain-containing protein [Acidimicrobiales bacterium]|nr:NifU N-terminal domain-containing protein [Acidimicrobiales bacterium]
MATATPSPTPNPDAMKYTLDTTLPEMINVSTPEAAAPYPFAAAILAGGGVASVFATADFVTVTRRPGADWESITPAVQAAAAEHL